MLVQDKHSFGPKSTTGAAYRIETRSIDHDEKTYKTSGVVWIGHVEIDSQGLLAGNGHSEESADRDDAANFLQEVLAEGGRPPKQIEQEGKAAGFSFDQLKRAKPQAGVRPRKNGFSGEWIWELKTSSQERSISQGSEPSTCQTSAPYARFDDGSDTPDAGRDLGAHVSEGDIQEILEQELGATVVEERLS